MVAVSRPGGEQALRLRRGLPEADLFLPEGFPSPGEAVVGFWQGPLRDTISRVFQEYRGLVLFGSVGLAVRLVGPLARDKRTDPAVVVVDDAGRFAISLLSGHLGGANDLARRVGEILGAQPVITTGSEVLGTLAADLLGGELGWRIEGTEQMTRVSAAMVNGEPVGLLQEAGERDWWPQGQPLPPSLRRFSSLEELAASPCRAALIITDRLLPGVALPPHVVYRPRSLVVGIGCNAGTGAEEIGRAIEAALDSHGLALAGVGKLATVDLKGNEPGLRQYAEKLGVPIEYHTAAVLDAVPDLPNPSEIARRWVGTRGVCEPAALLSSGARALLVPKIKMGNVTVAVARIHFEGDAEESAVGS